MSDVFRALSWGCGVQSTTLGEMSMQGLLPKLDAIITSDTGWERNATYEIRDWYTARWEEAGTPVYVVTGGNVKVQGAEEHIHIPFWTSTGGPLQRQCTRHFKILPVKRKIRELLGYHPSKAPHPKPGSVELWIGISLDEWTRAKDSRVKFIKHRWPLLEKRIDREGCKLWLKEQGLPVPVQSACIGCPYRRASEWIQMRNENQEEFLEACRFDEENRHNPLASEGVESDELFVYKHGPLSTADLEKHAARERIKSGGIQLPMAICDSGYCWT